MKELNPKVAHGPRDVPEGALEEARTIDNLRPENEDEEGFYVSEEQKTFLRESLDQARRGESVEGWQPVKELRDRS